MNANIANIDPKTRKGHRCRARTSSIVWTWKREIGLYGTHRVAHERRDGSRVALRSNDEGHGPLRIGAVRQVRHGVGLAVLQRLLPDVWRDRDDREPQRLRCVQRRARMPDVPDRPPSFNTSLTLVLDACSAGASPNTTPVASETSAKKPKTRASIVNLIQ